MPLFVMQSTGSPNGRAARAQSDRRHSPADRQRGSLPGLPVAPGGGITWLINNKLRLQAVFPRPALVYQPNDDWDIRALGELNFLGARTGEVHTTEQKLQLDNALVQYSEYRAGLQVGYSGFKPFKIIAGAGCTIQRNFDFFRAEQSKRTDPAPYIRIAAEARF